MDTAQWPQGIVVKSMEEMVVPHGTACSKQQLPSSSLERKIRPQKEQAINCPRCNSTNTKFCYYNNYSLSQPRYFCKTCRRYWTEGGSLRNIPVGGGSRKNKRSSSSSLASPTTLISSNPNIINNSMPSNPTSASPKNLPDLILHHHQNPNGQDLNLGFSTTAHDFKTISELIQVPNFSSFLPMHIPNSDNINPNSVFSSASGFSLPEFKPSSLGFSLDGGYGSLHHSVQESSGRLLFPFEDLKQASNANTASNDQNRDQNVIGDSTAGYWSGILGGGGEESGGRGGGEGSW